MTSREVLVGALAGALVFGFGVGVVGAQEPKPQEPAPQEPAREELPTPPEGWWEQVKGGEFATYEMTQMGAQFTMKLLVDSREGSTITFTTTMQMADAPQGGGFPPRTQKIDFADPAQVNAKMKMPKDATVKKIGEESIAAAGREWPCTVYEIEGTERGQKMKMKLWHSTELLPVFSNGAVKMHVEMMGPNGQPMKVEMNLTEVGTEPKDGTAPDPAPAPQGGQPGTPGKG